MAKRMTAAEARLAEETTQVPAVLDPAFAVGAYEGVKVKRHVTIPVLKWGDGQTIIFMAVDAIREGKELTNVKAGTIKMEPADLMTIASPAGELRTLIVNKVFGAALIEGYPKDSYVNKWFRAHRFAPDTARGKKYATFSVQEIEKPSAG